MKNRIKLLFVLALSLIAGPAFAQSGADAGGDALGKGLGVVGIGLAGLGVAIGIGVLAGRLLEAIARQPELEAKLRNTFFLGVGLTDAVLFIVIGMVFALV